MEEDHTTLLSGVGLFESLSQEQLGRIAHGIPAKTFEVGEHVFTPTYRGEVFSCSLKGGCASTAWRPDRKSPSACWRPERCSARRPSLPGKGSYAQAIKPSKIAFLNRSTFYRLIQREPELGIRAIELLGERLSFYEQRIADLGHKKVPARLASLILQLAETEGIVAGQGHYCLRIPYTHEELSLMVGAKRVAVSRAMKGLREAGAVDSGRRSIVVRDAEALGRIANEVA